MATYFLWDELEDNLIEEYDDNGATIAAYTTEPTLYGTVLTQDRGGEVRHFHYDGQGNTSALTDNNGTVTDTLKYSAFGETSHRTGGTESPFFFGGKSGYYTDTQTGQISIRRRTYYPQRGFWTSADPLGLVGAANVYAYVMGNPIMYHDPSGLAPLDEVTSTLLCISLSGKLPTPCGRLNYILGIALAGAVNAPGGFCATYDAVLKAAGNAQGIAGFVNAQIAAINATLGAIPNPGINVKCINPNNGRCCGISTSWNITVAIPIICTVAKCTISFTVSVSTVGNMSLGICLDKKCPCPIKGPLNIVETIECPFSISGNWLEELGKDLEKLKEQMGNQE